MKKITYTLFLISLAISSCKKEPGFSMGSNNIVYESQGSIDLLTNMTAFINTSTLYVDNASPYYQMLGQVIADAKEAKIDGNGTEISNIELSNVKISEIQLRCTNNLSELRNLLGNCTLELQYYDIPTNSYTGLTLGTFTEVNMQSAMVEFALSQNDLSTFMKNRPDRMFLKFNFNSLPTNSIEVKYKIFYSFEYSYDERELKD